MLGHVEYLPLDLGEDQVLVPRLAVLENVLDDIVAVLVLD
jgi:hypothetical protein